jgi:hypothetical protein
MAHDCAAPTEPTFNKFPQSLRVNLQFLRRAPPGAHARMNEYSSVRLQREPAVEKLATSATIGGAAFALVDGDDKTEAGTLSGAVPAAFWATAKATS